MEHRCSEDVRSQAGGVSFTVEIGARRNASQICNEDIIVTQRWSLGGAEAPHVQA